MSGFSHARLVKAFAVGANLTKLDADGMVKLLTAIIGTATWKHGRVAIPGFGVFYMKRTRARTIMAPPGSMNAGELIRLPASETLAFRASKRHKRLGVRQ